jgi:hypothetical protein
MIMTMCQSRPQDEDTMCQSRPQDDDNMCQSRPQDDDSMTNRYIDDCVRRSTHQLDDRFPLYPRIPRALHSATSSARVFVRCSTDGGTLTGWSPVFGCSISPLNFMLPKRRFWKVEPTFPGRVFEALFKGVSTLFGPRSVEKCFENTFRTVC